MDREHIDFDADETLAADIYKDNNGDELAKDIVDEFNAYEIVKNHSAQVTSETHKNIVRNMVKNILIMFYLPFEPYQKGNDFKTTVAKLKEAQEILNHGDLGKKGTKQADGFSNNFWLKDDPWVHENLDKLIEFLECSAKKKRGGKQFLSLAVANEVLKSWRSMERDTVFDYKNDEEFSYEQKEPATVFAAFVNAVEIEIERIMRDHPFKEYKDLHGLRDNIRSLRKGKTSFN